jgi:hypothetical protein
MEATMNHAPRVAKGVCIVAGLLSGCSEMPIPNEPNAGPTPVKPVLCVAKAQCDNYWQRAQAWVANNSEYGLETVTDTVIETHGPVAGRPGLAFRVTRVPDTKDGGRIFIIAACANAFGCSPAPADALVAFRRFVTN